MNRLGAGPLTTRQFFLKSSSQIAPLGIASEVEFCEYQYCLLQLINSCLCKRLCQHNSLLYIHIQVGSTQSDGVPKNTGFRSNRCVTQNFVGPHTNFNKDITVLLLLT